MELKRVLSAVAAAGAASLLAQVVLLREVLASAQGNELVLGLVLSFWLVLTGIASALGGRLSPERARRWLLPLLISAPALLLASLVLVAWAAPGVAGQAPSLPRLVGVSLTALVPACALSGLAFAWGLAAAGGAIHSGLLYAVETLGAAAAGALFHFALADRVGSSWIVLGAGCIACLASLVLAGRRGWPFVLVAAVVAGSVVVVPAISRALTASRFPGEQVLALQPSRYGLLAVVGRGAQRAFFHDGELLFTTEDQLAAEERVHLPLLLHPSPRRVLLVGGGLDGGLTEALRHAPARLDYAELDPAILELGRRLADVETRRALARVETFTEDARHLVARPPIPYDVIVITVPVPQNALAARLLSRECVADARRALAPGGLLAIVTPGAESHLDPAARRRHASMLATLSAVFPVVGVAPGETTTFWAAESAVESAPALLARRLVERHLRPSYVGPAWLFDKLLPFHAQEYRRAVAQAAPVESRDLRPFVYAIGLVEGLERMSPSLARAGLWALDVPRPWWLLAASMSFALLLFVRRRASRIALAVATVGGAGMAMQLVLLFSFQAIVGHLYHAVGGLLACFMAGMAAGALAARRLMLSNRPRSRLLARACAGVAVVAGAAPLALLSALRMGAWASALLFALTALMGAAVGAVYPVATHLAGPASAARLYAWDLGGAATAALLVTALAIPILGLPIVAALAAMLAALAAVVVLEVR